MRRYLYSGTILISKKFIVLLHTLSGYNSLLVRYKFYLPYPRECLCTSWKYAEGYENFSIDPIPCRKNPIKNKIIILNCQPLLLGEYYTEIKAWQLKFAKSDPCSHEKLHWNKTVTAKVSFKNLQWFSKKTSFETEHLRQPFDNKSWY